MNTMPNLRVACRWTSFAGNVTAAANRILGTNVSLQGAAFSGSSHSTTGFSPQAIFKNGILSSPGGSQIKLCVISLSQSQANRSNIAMLRTDTSFFVGFRSTTTAGRFAAETMASYKISCQKLASGAISRHSLLISPR